jgi:hypothetical protein
MVAVPIATHLARIPFPDFFSGSGTAREAPRLQQ